MGGLEFNRRSEYNSPAEHPRSGMLGSRHPLFFKKHEKRMPKLKSKSSAKKRFSMTGRSKLRRRAACHRHNLTKRAKKVKRNQRAPRTLASSDAALVRPFLPYL